jgi:hypothetical protein
MLAIAYIVAFRTPLDLPLVFLKFESDSMVLLQMFL